MSESKYGVRITKDSDAVIRTWEWRLIDLQPEGPYGGERLSPHFSMTPFRSINTSGRACTRDGAERAARRALRRWLGRQRDHQQSEVIPL